MRASVLEVLGFGGSQGVRLASSLVLTRMLLESDYGLATTVAIFNYGLVMLSDVGIGQAFVRSKNADEPRFVDTVWTMQVVRGCMLWLVGCLLAWPCAWYFEKEQLLSLLPVGALTVMLHGFAATNILRLRRDLVLAPVVAIDLIAQLLSVGGTILWAWLHPSVWALVVGPMLGEFFRLAASYCVGPRHRHRLCWDAGYRHEIFNFGKWIFASSSLCFLSTQSDRPMLLKLVGETTLGIYSLALNLSSAVGMVLTRVTHSVLFPAFSQIHRERPESLAAIYYRVRLRIDVLAFVPLGILTSCSEWLIGFLYEDQWSAAGWMMKLLCIKTAIVALHTPCETALFSAGHTRFSFYRDVTRAVFLFAGAPLAYAEYGLDGLLWAICLIEVPPLFVLWGGARRHGFLRIERELLAVLLFGLGLGAGALLAPLLPNRWW